MIIDTHAHLYSKEFDGDRSDMIQRALQAGVRMMFLPNVDLDTIDVMKETMALAPDHIFPMIGLHPCSVQKNFESVLAKMKDELETGFIYYGIGETGIDLYWDKSTYELQVEALKIQSSWAVDHNLPIILHTRNANEEVLSFFENLDQRPSRGIFHCFSGSDDHIERIDALGDYYYGIGGVITYKNGGLYEAIHKIPLHKIVLETDSPYLPPVPFRGKRNESAYILYVAQKLADALNKSLDEILEITSDNAQRLFALENDINPHTIIG